MAGRARVRSAPPPPPTTHRAVAVAAAAAARKRARARLLGRAGKAPPPPPLSPLSSAASAAQVSAAAAQVSRAACERHSGPRPLARCGPVWAAACELPVGGGGRRRILTHTHTHTTRGARSTPPRATTLLRAAVATLLRCGAAALAPERNGETHFRRRKSTSRQRNRSLGSARLGSDRLGRSDRLQRRSQRCSKRRRPVRERSPHRAMGSGRELNNLAAASAFAHRRATATASVGAIVLRLFFRRYDRPTDRGADHFRR